MGFVNMLQSLGGAAVGAGIGAGGGALAGKLIPGVSVGQGAAIGSAVGGITGLGVASGAIGKLIPGGGDGNGNGGVGGRETPEMVGGLRPTQRSIRAHFGRRISNQEFAELFGYYPARRRSSRRRSSRSSSGDMEARIALKVLDAIK